MQNNKSVKDIKEKCQRIDNYVYEKCSYVLPKGVPYADRLLVLGTEIKPYNVCEIVKPIALI